MKEITLQSSPLREWQKTSILFLIKRISKRFHLQSPLGLSSHGVATTTGIHPLWVAINPFL